MRCFRLQRQRGKLVLFEAETGYPWVTTLVDGNILADVGKTAAARGSGTHPPDGKRTHLTRDDLFQAAYVGDGPVHNAHFMPVGEIEPALHRLSGRLSVSPFALLGRMELGFGYEWFPGFEVDFFSHDGRLVPVERGLILPRDEKSALTLILSPGRVWSEPGDDGLSRASFPFVLGTTTGNAAHNGLASFLYGDGQISKLRIQVVQETAPVFFELDLWGQGPMHYRPSALAGAEALRRRFEDELKEATEIRPWAELAAKHGPEKLADFAPNARGDDPAVAGLIVDDVIYAMPCRSRFGDYPYCAEMRHAADGLGKTLGTGLALLWLAQKYGDWVYDLRIRDYVEVTERHRGWDRVRFADALDMATGIGNPLSPYLRADEHENARESRNTRSMAEKLAWIFKDGDLAARPGTRFRYRSNDSTVLSAAMDGFLKREAGPDARLWEMLGREVLRPIGIRHAPMRESLEPGGGPGVALLAEGLYPTIDDVAKLAQLLHGRHRGQQLLDGNTLARIMDFERRQGLPTERPGWRYLKSFWLWRFASADGACERWIPVLSGAGGQLVMLLPNAMTAFRFADDRTHPVEAMAHVADRLRPFCP